MTKTKWIILLSALVITNERIPVKTGDIVIEQSIMNSPEGYCIASTEVSIEDNPLKHGRTAYHTNYPCNCDTSSCQDLLKIQRKMSEPSIKQLKERFDK